MRKIQLARDVVKELDRLEPKHYKQVVNRIFSLAVDPQPADAKPLTGYSDWRADQGEHRIIYEFDEATLFVNLIGKRNGDEVYKDLRRSKRGPK